MNVKQLFLFLMLMYGAAGNAQQATSPTICAKLKQTQPLPGAKTTAYIPEADDYDIKHVKFDIAMSNTSTYVQGVVTTTAKVTASSMSVYAFELNALITVDSVKINNVLRPVTSIDSIRKVTLASSLITGTFFTAAVYYHGSTPAGKGGFFMQGLTVVTTSPDSFRILYSITDKDRGGDWWPCKQNIIDKIDSVDMWVTVADTLKVGSNGLLKNVTSMPGNKLRYEWKTKYPIDYYLISVAIAPYNEYNYYMHYTDGSNDSMLVQNYIYNTSGHFTTQAKAALDTTGLIIDYFSTLFGRYPFYKEKYGHCMSPLSGGMEHQTMTTMTTDAYNNIPLIPHELGHQWWGDNVTYGSWQDIWLSEGFATYCEQLFIEHFHGAQAMVDYRAGVISNGLDATKAVYVDDTTSTVRIFRYSTTYSKGAIVAHMLRYLAPTDSQFFKVLKKYQQLYDKGNAVTTDLQNLFEQEYATDLDTFFRQWVYGIGYPTYSAKWYQDNNKMVGIQLKQSTANTSVGCYWMPVEVKLITTAGDRFIKLMNNTNSTTSFIYCDSTVTGIEIDPNYHILRRIGLISKDAAIMSINDAQLRKISVLPNPTSDSWTITNAPAGALLQLNDMNGRQIWKGEGNVVIPAINLPKGNYVLLISVNNKTAYKQLVKN